MCNDLPTFRVNMSLKLIELSLDSSCIASNNIMRQLLRT